jgi:hypothetical protein
LRRQIDHRSVGQNGGQGFDADLAKREQLLVERERAQSPIAVSHARDATFDEMLDPTVLLLKMLRPNAQPLRPKWLAYQRHAGSTLSIGA